MPHFGVAHRGRKLSPPNLNSVEIFVQCTYPQVSSSYVYSFRSYRVDTQTHKYTNRCRRKHPTFFTTLRRWVNTHKTQICSISRIIYNCLLAVDSLVLNSFFIPQFPDSTSPTSCTIGVCLVVKLSENFYTSYLRKNIAE